MLTKRDKISQDIQFASSSASTLNASFKDDDASILYSKNQDILLKKGELSHQLLEDHHSPIGLLSEHCQHEDVLRFDLKPQFWSWSGLDIVITEPEVDGSMKKSTGAKERQPFYISGKKLISATLCDSDHKQLYSMHQKWTSIHTHYYAKNMKGEKVLELRTDKLMRFDLTATFNNTASGTNEQRKLQFKTGMVQKISELRDEDGKLLATIERPSKAKMCLPNEAYRVTIAPKVDTSMVMAICLGMHAQLLTFKVGTYYAPSTAAVLASSGSS